MINFFKRLRYVNMETGKTSRYFKYALGEIILVVIGILIALSINNWSETSKIRKREQVLLNEIHQEFLNNKAQLETVVTFHKKAYRACTKLIAEFPIDLNTVNLDSLSTYLYETQWRYSFNPSQGSINSFINTASFETITNDKLRQHIVSWQDQVNDYLDEEITANYIDINFYEPYLSKHFPFDCNLKNPKTDLAALMSLEFEHLVGRRREGLNDVLNSDNELGKLQEKIDEIIVLTDPNNWID